MYLDLKMNFSISVGVIFSSMFLSVSLIKNHKDVFNWIECDFMKLDKNCQLS